MDLDDDLCLCFHVSKRKVINFLRITRPQRAAQLSECQGAGTGCGWCRPYLQKLFEEHQAQGRLEQIELPAADDYAAQRDDYRRQK